jgi:membrane protease YdiL (CAAX protease family)
LQNLKGISDRVLLLNLYLTQGLSVVIALILFYFQKRNPLELFQVHSWGDVILWGGGLAVLVIGVDLIVSRFVPEHLTDDGGVNERIFGRRAIWHIVVISAVVAVAEELLFRGAIQHSIGPYWTSILFAAIHIRYLQHWILTGMVFLTSYALGWIIIHTDQWLSAVIAHFLIDVILGLILRYEAWKNR